MRWYNGYYYEDSIDYVIFAHRDMAGSLHAYAFSLPFP
jgi:hypothetical protein